MKVVVEATYERPILEANPEDLNFGLLEEDAEESLSFSLTSIGERAVEIESIEIEGAESFSLIWEESTMTLEPGDSTDLIVIYTPLSMLDLAKVRINNDSIEPELYVGLTGSGMYPAISVDPAMVSLKSTNEQPVQKEVSIKSVGSATLEIDSFWLQEEDFSVDLETPLSIEPGEEHIIQVTYYPDGDDDTDLGSLWLSTNTEDGATLIPLRGDTPPPCYGLGEAWDRNLLDIYSNDIGEIIFRHLGDEDDSNICMDRWYVLLSEYSQDAGVGDPFYDPIGDYPYGTITITPGQDLVFSYMDSQYPSWVCMERSQLTHPTSNWDFLGARVPQPLLGMMLTQNQQEVWDWMRTNPVIITGRSTHYVTPSQQNHSHIRLNTINMGQFGANVTISETIPPGFTAYNFSYEPFAAETTEEGTTYLFDIYLQPAIISDPDLPTHYDEIEISYSLEPPEECQGRITGYGPVAQWTDQSGTIRNSDGSPLILYCE